MFQPPRSSSFTSQTRVPDLHALIYVQTTPQITNIRTKTKTSVFCTPAFSEDLSRLRLTADGLEPLEVDASPGSTAARRECTLFSGQAKVVDVDQPAVAGEWFARFCGVEGGCLVRSDPEVIGWEVYSHGSQRLPVAPNSSLRLEVHTVARFHWLPLASTGFQRLLSRELTPQPNSQGGGGGVRG